MLIGGGEETATLRDKEVRGRVRYDTHCLWTPSHGGIFFQVPEMDTVGFIRQLPGSGLELAESAAEMGSTVAGAWTGGVGFVDL